MRGLVPVVRAAAVVFGRARRVAVATVRTGRGRWLGSDALRSHDLGRRNATPLPSLYDVHPEARRLVRRDAGLRTVSVDEVLGTAVAGPAQRGSDFLPLPGFRSGNWAARWQRIRGAVERLVVLPPIDVVHYAGGYWVEDGHNRVAAALYAGQVAIDAIVTEFLPPGGQSTLPTAKLASTLEGSREMRTAAETGFANRPSHVHERSDPL